MIELTNFTYKTNKVLFDGASFKAPSTGMIGIAGESGCGKTTFLKIISKQIHLDSMVDYSLVIAPVVADLCTTPVALSAPPNSYQNNSQS